MIVGLTLVPLSAGRNATERKGGAWDFAREEQWRGIVYSDVIIAAGFAIFVLSDFPPTQRFGLVCLPDVLSILSQIYSYCRCSVGAPSKKRV